MVVENDEWRAWCIAKRNFLNQPFKFYSCNCQPWFRVISSKPRRNTLRTLGKIVATLGVVSAIAVGSAAPAAAWYGYHHRYYHHHYGYYHHRYHHRHYYAYHPYYHHHHRHHYWY